MFVEHPWINKNIIEKRAYQENIAKSAVNDNTLVCLPTGLGKTSVAALVVADRLQKYMDKKILFLAPTKPLVEQHRQSFERFLKIGVDELKVVTGSIEPEERSELYRKADIIFSTPQTIENDLKKGRINLKDFSLLIVDEAHRSIGNYAYAYVASRYMHQAEKPLILALTASPGAHRYKINEVREKLFIKNVEIRTRDDEDVRPYIQHVENEVVEVELPIPMKSVKKYLEEIKDSRIKKLMNWGILKLNFITKTQALSLQQELARRKTGYSYAAMSVLAEIIKVDHALMLLETQCLYSLEKYLNNVTKNDKTKAVSRLLKDENFNNAVRLTSELINEGAEHPKLEKLREIVSNELQKNKETGIIIFSQFRDTIEKIKKSLESVHYAAPIEFIGQTKKNGKGLSQKEQTEILNEFRLGFYNILIASSVGEEGLSLEETDNVIFYEPVPSAVRRIQRSGRTGRTRSGKVTILITKGTRDEAYHWSGRNNEKKMIKTLREMQSQKDLIGFR